MPPAKSTVEDTRGLVWRLDLEALCRGSFYGGDGSLNVAHEAADDLLAAWA